MSKKQMAETGIWIMLVFAGALIIFTLWKVVAAELFLYGVAEGVTLENVDVAGCSREEVEKIVKEMTKTIEREPVPAEYDQQFDSIIPEVNGWRVDTLTSIEKVMIARKGEAVSLVRTPILPDVMASDYPTARIYVGNSAKREITLLINVDWGVPQPLQRMLDTLEEEKVTTTFCVTGRIADKFPQEIAAISQRGHEIANHGYHHDSRKYPYKQLSLSSVKHEILSAEKSIFTATGEKPVFFSPPAGVLSDNIIKATNECGNRLVLWTPGLDTVDWQEPGVEIIAKRVLNGAKNGGIVLMHPKEQTAEALPQIIEGLKSKGFSIVPLRVLLSPYYCYEESIVENR